MKTKLFILICGLCFLQSANSQCFLDRHSTDWNDGWESCTMAPNPNDARGTTHWIHYDLGYDYILNEMHLWNSNAFGKTDQGVQEFYVDYSLDGITWDELGVYSLSQATGSGFYEGFQGPDFNGAAARYVLITPISNYGGSCYSLGELRIEVESVVVPVELAFFNANCSEDGSYVNLEWETTTEINSDYFVIEKSQNGEDWKKLMDIKAQGNSANQTNYTERDLDVANGKNYYRLIQYDLDGKRNDLSMVVSDCERDITGVTISPNPFREETLISIQSNDPSDIEMKIYNSIGLLVYQKQYASNNGITQIRFESENLSVGQYYLSIEQGSQKYRKKLVVQ